MLGATFVTVLALSMLLINILLWVGRADSRSDCVAAGRGEGTSEWVGIGPLLLLEGCFPTAAAAQHVPWGLCRPSRAQASSQRSSVPSLRSRDDDGRCG